MFNSDSMRFRRLLVPLIAIVCLGSVALAQDGTYIDATNFVNFFSTPVNPKLADPAPMREVKDPAGFRYIDFAYGKGDSSQMGKRHFIRFIGAHSNGDLFDTSYCGARLFSFVMGNNEALKGLEMGISSMRCGSRRQLILPPTLAYGVNGYPSVGILSNETLVFFIELVKVE